MMEELGETDNHVAFKIGEMEEFGESNTDEIPVSGQRKLSAPVGFTELPLDVIESPHIAIVEEVRGIHNPAFDEEIEDVIGYDIKKRKISDASVISTEGDFKRQYTLDPSPRIDHYAIDLSTHGARKRPTLNELHEEVTFYYMLTSRN